MTYLILKIVICLLIAAAIGLLMGWMLKGIASRKTSQQFEKHNNEQIGQIRSLERDREDAVEKLKKVEQEKQTLEIRIAEIEYASRGE